MLIFCPSPEPDGPSGRTKWFPLGKSGIGLASDVAFFRDLAP
jgi:hypothetical protein